MPMRCKNEDCDNTFLTTDGYTGGYCEDCYNEQLEKDQDEENV